MLERLKRRAAKAGLLNRLDARLASPDSMALADLAGSVDFTLAFAGVDEFPDAREFFRQIGAASKSRAFAFCCRSPEATSNPRSSKASWMQPARAASVCTRGLRCRAAMQLFCRCFRVGAVSSSLALRSRAWHAPESRESSQSSPNRATLESRLSAPSSSPRLQDA
jgi:hypothetical protein